MFKQALGVAIAACVLAIPLTPYAHDVVAGALRISHPWGRPTPSAAPTAVAYLTITNTGRDADLLTGASSPFADRVEIHRMTMTGGIMRMRLISAGLPMPAGRTVKLEPEGYHLMLVGPKRPFRIGDHIPATLRFQRAGAVKVEFDVLAAAPVGDKPMSMDMR